MRPRNLTLAFILLAVLAGFAYVLTTRPTVSDGVAGLTASDTPERTREQDVLSVPDDVVGGMPKTSRTVQEPLEQVAPTGTDSPEPAASGSEATGIVVAGVVRFSESGTPAADASLVLRHPGGYVLVRADEAGHFTTEPVIQPGVVRFLHRKTDEAGPYRHRLLLAPESTTVFTADGDEAFVEVTLLRPEAVLTVNVVYLNGRPAPDANVQFERQHEPRPGEFVHRAEAADTQEDGSATFALYGLEHLRAAGLIARLEEIGPDDRKRELVSEHVLLEIPASRELLTKPVRLVLDAAGSILVSTIDESRAPVVGQGIVIRAGDPFLSSWTEATPVSDERGEVLFTGLSPREYDVGFPGSPGDARRKVSVQAGIVSEVGFVLSTGRTQLAVSGTVVDEEGEPLAGVQLQVTYGDRAGSGDTSAMRPTDTQGRFEFRAAPADGLVVASNRNVFGDEFDPAEIALPFGSTGVLFRRTRKVARVRVAFEVVDAASGERLKETLVMTYRAPDLRDYSFHRSDEGLASPLCPDHPATTMVIEHAGYRRATVRVLDLMQQEPREGLRRVALERGMLRRLHVEGFGPDGESGPVSGASVLFDGRLLGRTDAAGELLVDLYAWPENGLTVEAERFFKTTWMPIEGLAELEPAWVWLE